jgi:two-component system response regulator AtoC
MKILVVDDDRNILDLIAGFLELEDDMEPLLAENGFSAKRILENEVVAAVISDLSMPDMDGLELLKWIQQEGPSIPVIMMSGYGGITDAVEAMKNGAQDYVVKPVAPVELIIRLRRLIQNQELQGKVELGKRESLFENGWIGDSPKMLEIKKIVEKVASTLSTVLITGESGTGKEVIARTIHRLSPRAKKSFIAVNIGGIPETLLESELFGYERGAFTDAVSRKIGMFELASGGTFFLDEIGDMPSYLQVKLLRVIQERKIQRLGGTQSIPIDVRILAATNQDLEKRVKEGLFREDLYYRLNVIQIKIPPLKDRREDIPQLVGHFIRKYNTIMGKSIRGIEPESLRALQHYDFPGNIRELENLIERVILLTETDIITLKDLDITETVPSIPVKEGTLADLEKQAILASLRRWEGNRTRAAEELGITRRTLLNKIKVYGFQNV